MKKKNSKLFKTLLNIIIAVLLCLSIGFNIFLFTKDNKVEIKNDENIIFFGDSITHAYSLNKYYPKKNVINKGTNGDKTVDLINRINTDVYEYNPSKIFILIGINDLAMGYENQDILSNLQQIINGIKINRKKTKIYIESIYPINREKAVETNTFFVFNIDNANIMKLNNDIKNMCEENDITYIDVYSKMVDGNNQ